MDEKQLSERMMGLLTLICDKINSRGYMLGAHNNSNWCTQAYYEFVPNAERIQGTLDRIGKIEYWRIYHTDEKKLIEPTLENSFSCCERVGKDVYDHAISCIWREPFGKGLGPNLPEAYTESSMTKDKAGNWHPPRDLSMCVNLWHPSSQNGRQHQESISGCWLKSPPPNWRPTYSYTDDEVVEALKIMCDQFNWEFDDKGESEWMTIY